MKALKLISRVIAAIVLVALLGIIITSISPIYDFAEPTPFSGKSIFNPYRNFDPTIGWKRANFHTHTRVDGILNECKYTPAQTLEAYDRFDYDIVTLSNHNYLTKHPTDSTLQVNCYEHGYNLLKFHKLVFGSDEIWELDHMLPILASQKQLQIDVLSKQSDIVVLNHPLRTHTLGHGTLEKLCGYQIIELDSGKSTENEYWDAALSAGRYSFALANDDLHYPDRAGAIAMRSNMLNVGSARYDDIRTVLLDGCYYSMRTPNYGNGNWEVKIERNRTIPRVRNIGLSGNDEIYISLSKPADSIKIFGQGHTTLASAYATDSLGYQMQEHNAYARFTAYFEDGEVIYSNPFARYDSTRYENPFQASAYGYTTNTTLTILFNTMLLALLIGVAVALYKIVKR